MLPLSSGVYIREENHKIKLNKMWPVKIMKGIGAVLRSLFLSKVTLTFESVGTKS